MKAMPVLGVSLLAALVLARVLLSPLSTVQASPPEAPPPTNFQQGAILVKFKPMVSFAADLALGSQGLRTISAVSASGVRKVAVAPGSEESTARALSGSPLVEYAEPNYIRSASYAPNDPRYNDQWALPKINAPSAWDITTGSPAIIVAIIDTGIDIGHPDRPQNLLLGADFIVDPTGGTLVSGDPQGHGTHVAGIVAARMNNGAGVTGVAPGVTIMSVRVLDAQGSGDTYTTARAITYAADHGAKIISLSLAGLDKSTAEEQAVNYAYGKGALVVAAAGNCYEGGVDCGNQINPANYPGALEHVVAAAATDVNDAHARYSETGSYVDLAAPGNSILSTCINSAYCRKSGTSMATPYVAGVAALAWSANPSLTADQIDSILRRSALDLGAPGRDDVFGQGRVDANGAASRARDESATPAATPTSSPTATPTRTHTPTPAPTATVAPITSPSPTATASPPPAPVAGPSTTPTSSPSTTATPAAPITPFPIPTAVLTSSPTPVQNPPLLTSPLGPTPIPTQKPPLLSFPISPTPGAMPTPHRVFMPVMAKNNGGW